MSAKIKILGVVATVENGKWSCEDKTALEYLEEQAKHVGDSPEIPDLDEFLALDARSIGAEVIQHSDKPAPDAGTVY